MARVEAERRIAGRYRLDRFVRAAASATVWEAEDLWYFRRRVDVAILATPGNGDKESTPHVRQAIERVLWPWFSHPNAVRLQRYGEHDGVRFVVMEHVGGETLRSKLRREGRLRPKTAARIAAAIASAVHSAHEAGVVHGDLRADRVVITPSGGAKVLDLGLTTAAWKTLAGKSSAGPLDDEARADDIHGVGVMLYEMLSGWPSPELPNGNHPFEPDQVVLSRIGPAARERLVGIFERTLSGGPTRFATAGELATELVEIARPSHEQPEGQAAKTIARDPILTIPERGGEALVELGEAPASPSPPDARASAVQEVQPIPPETTLQEERSEQPKGGSKRLLTRRGVVTALIVLTVAAASTVAALKLTSKPTREAKASSALLTPAPSHAAAPTASSAPTAAPIPNGVRVPNLVGLTVDQALKRLEAIGLNLVGVLPTEGTPGQVVRSVPEFGAFMDPGSEVVLFVGAEPDRIPPGPPGG